MQAQDLPQILWKYSALKITIKHLKSMYDNNITWSDENLKYANYLFKYVIFHLKQYIADIAVYLSHNCVT